MQTDWKLLDKYITERSDASFAALLERHRNLVYSVCIRELSGDATLAEDATQVVFLILAKKAKSLRREVMLTGWLFRTARFTASQLRRRKRSQESRSILWSEDVKELQVNAPDVSWSDLDAHLNDALARLAEKDRVAVLMRYFDQMSFAEIASVSGQNEDAVRHRVNRALEKMRRMLASPDGAALPAAAFAALLAENAVKPAPAHAASLAESLSVKSNIDGSFASLHQITQGVLKAMFIKQVGLAAAVVITVSLSVSGGIEITRAQEKLASNSSAKLTSANQYTLPSGATVRLLGVSRLPESDKSWWSPDGIPLAHAPKAAAKLPISAGSQPGSDSREFLIEILRGKLSDNVGSMTIIPNVPLPPMNTTESVATYVEPPAYYTAFTEHVSPKATECTVLPVAFVPSGPGGFTTASSGPPPLDIEFKHVQLQPRRSSVATLLGSKTVRITAIHITGNTVEPTAKLLALVTLKIGQKLGVDAAANSLLASTQKINDVYGADGYRGVVGEHLTLDPKSGAVTIPIIEARITAITLSGSHVSIPASGMTQALAAHGVVVGAVYNKNSVRKAVTGIDQLPGTNSVGPVYVQTPEPNQVTLDIPVRDNQGGGAITRPIALSNSSPSQGSPALPRQMTITFQFVETTPAERAQAAKNSGAPGESAAYFAALLRAGAVTIGAPVVTDTEGVSAGLNFGTSTLDQKLTLKPTINSDGTITLVSSVALSASVVSGSPKPGKASILQSTSVLQDGTKRLIGSLAGPTAKGEVWYVFATVRVIS